MPSSVIQLGGSTAQGGIVATADIQSTPVGTDADTDEKTLFTYTMPANIFDVGGSNALRIKVYGTTGANANNKTIRFKFDGTVLVTSAGTYDNNVWCIEVMLMGNSTAQTAMVHMHGTAAGAVTVMSDSVQTGLAKDGTTPLAIIVTGQNDVAVANDVIASLMTVEYLSSTT